MKNRIVLLMIGFLLVFTANAQVTNKIQADSVRIWQTGGLSAELILENSTRSKQGAFLRNRINGRTEFAYALDSVYLEGKFLKFRRGSNTIAFSWLSYVDTLYRSSDSIYFEKDGLTYNLGTYLTKNTADLLYSALGHTHTFTSLTSKPTTKSGYGITDVVGYVDTAGMLSHYAKEWPLLTLTEAATIIWDFSLSHEAKITLTGSRTLSITNLPSDRVVYGTIAITQDATGGRAITLPAGSKVINGGSGTVSLTAIGGATDILVFRWNGTNLFWTIGKNFN